MVKDLTEFTFGNYYTRTCFAKESSYYSLKKQKSCSFSCY